MKSETSEPRPPSAPLPGVLDEETLSHLLDVELARARRYEHPFAVVRVTAAGDAAQMRRLAGALRLITRWADSVGRFGGSLMVILRDTPPEGARLALEKIGASLAAEIDGGQALRLESAEWRKGDDRARLLGRLR